MQQKKMAKLAFYQNNLSLIPLTRVGPNKNFISCGSTQPEKKIGLTHLYSKMLFLGSFHFIIKLHSAQKIKYYKKMSKYSANMESVNRAQTENAS